MLNASFIRGYLDGDGSIGIYGSKSNKHKPDCRAYICSGSIKFIEQCKKIIEKTTNINANIRNGNNVYYLIVNGNRQVQKFLDWIYTDSTELSRLDRKYQKYLKISEINHG